MKPGINSKQSRVVPAPPPGVARIDAARADARGSLAAFDGAILNALQETETALSRYAGAIERRRSLEQAMQAATKTARITRAQNREGVIDSLDLLDAERTLAETRAELADQDALVSSRQIDLFRALGGSWSAEQETAS